MANYYTQCSVLLPYDTDEERLWLIDALEKATTQQCVKCRNNREECTCGEDGYMGDDLVASFCFSDEGMDDDLKRPAFWIRDEESFYGEDVLFDVVSRFQIQFGKQDFWECHFACTCSKQRLDGFSGFGVLIHRGEVHELYPHVQSYQLTDELAKRDDFTSSLPVHL